MALEAAVIAIANFVSILGIERLMRMYFTKRRTSFPVMVLLYFFCWVAMVISGPLLYANEAALVAFLVALAIASLNYEAQLAQRFTVVISLFALLLAMGSGIFVLLYHYAPINLSRYDTNIAHLMINSLTIFLLSLSLQQFKNLRKEMAFSFSPKFFVISLAIPVLSVVLLFLLVLFVDMPAFIELFAILIIFAINVLDIYLYNGLMGAHERGLEAALREREKEYYLEQCQLMQESLDQVVSVRHDMKAHLAVINGYATEAGATKAAEYIDGLLGGMNMAKMHSDTGNIAIDSIINFKLRNAERENVKPDIRLRVPPSLNVEASDVAVILGNLLDNALDAAARVEDKRIKLDVEYSREALFINVENAFDGEIKYAGKSAAAACEDEKRLPVTSKSGGDHGHGLRSVRRAVDKYDGYMGIAHEGNVFSVTVLLYVDGDEGQGKRSAENSKHVLTGRTLRNVFACHAKS